MKMKPFHEKDLRLGRARLDTTTKPAVDSLSPRRRSGEGQGEGISKERLNSMEGAPLPSPTAVESRCKLLMMRDLYCTNLSFPLLASECETFCMIFLSILS